MAKINLVVATDQNRVIGYQNKLPWHLPADLKHFKQLTLGKPIIMGRKTYESMGRPLPERINIIITRNQNYQAPGCEVFHSLQAALAAFTTEPEIMIIGGTALFEQALPFTHTLYLTLIHHVFAGDTYFPNWNEEEWQEIERQDHEPDEDNPYHYSFITLIRK